MRDSLFSTISKGDKLITIVITVAGVVIIGGILAMNFVHPRNTNTQSPRQIPIVIQNAEITGEKNISVKQNEQVRLLITADTNEQFHVEGYHAFTALPKGQATPLDLWAGTPGDFAIRLEKTNKVVGRLVVTQ